MKFFVDTADTAEIKSLAASGLLDGVTTNPSLMAKTGKKFQDVLAEICAVVPGPVSAEVAATEFDGMMAEARVLRGDRQEHHREGAADAGRAARLPPPDRRWRDGQRDAVLLGRPGDAGGQGRRHLRQPVHRPAGRHRRGRHGADRRHRDDLPQLSAFKTEVLVASVRNPMHVVEAAKLGAHVATVPPAVLRQLFNHPLTDKGLAAFLADWAKTGQQIA